MEALTATVEVRRRLLPALLGMALFSALGSLYSSEIWTQSWFYISLGMVASATFVEPFFAKPQDAIVNSAAGIGAYASATRVPIEGLWRAFLACLILVMISGIAAAILGGRESGTLKWATFRLATRFGRAVVVGASALLLVVLTEAAAGGKNFEWLAGATAVLVAAITVDWAGVFTRLRRQTEPAVVIAAIGPRMLLVRATSHVFREGDTVEVETSRGRTSGSIVSRLPHSDGLRYQVALAEEWTAICAAFPGEIVLRQHVGDSEIVGAVNQGTTERTLDFEPFGTLPIGAPVRLKVADQSLLYQVASLELVDSRWAGSHAVVARAHAHLIGWPEATGLRGGTHLPAPHEPVYDSQDITAELAPEYYGLGVVKGTGIPIGIRVDTERRGHIAVLGMSGMGKTAVAQRICATLGGDNVVVTLDTTGEYATKLGFPVWDGGLDKLGYSVYEPNPNGDPSTEAANFIKQCMVAGATEYKAGSTPIPRVILLEEAHTFVPEWNFALKNQQDKVAESTRMIMQARKFGITVLMVSQRTAVVSKSALSQCENYIILKTLDQTSLDYLEGLIGRTMRNAIPGLERFEAICIGPAFNAEEPVIVTLSPPAPPRQGDGSGDGMNVDGTPSP